MIPELPYKKFVERYCARQVCTPEGLLPRLQEQRRIYKPIGWMLLEVAYIGARNSGDLTILPYGPNSTLKEVPSHPISPRGLASDISTVVAILPVAELPITP